MSARGNSFLRHDNLITLGAMNALSKTACNTSGSNWKVNNVCMNMKRLGGNISYSLEVYGSCALEADYIVTFLKEDGCNSVIGVCMPSGNRKLSIRIANNAVRAAIYPKIINTMLGTGSKEWFCLVSCTVDDKSYCGSLGCGYGSIVGHAFTAKGKVRSVPGSVGCLVSVKLNHSAGSIEANVPRCSVGSRISVCTVGGINGFCNIKGEGLLVKRISPTGKNTCDGERITVISRKCADILFFSTRAIAAGLGKYALYLVCRSSSNSPLAIAVTESVYVAVSVGMSRVVLTNVSSVALRLACGCGHGFFVIMACFGDCLVGCVVTSGAGYVSIVTTFGTSWSFCIVRLLIVTESCLLCVGCVVAS